MTLEEWMAAFGGVYEHSPWVAERGYDAELVSPCCVKPALRKVVEAASRAEQDALINAHPDLAGRLALAGKLTTHSAREQAGAGLDQCSPRELGKFHKYNTAYREKFGFPFIIAVKGLDRKAILKAFKKRLKNDPETERRTALDEIHKIAGFRIDEWFASHD